MIQIQIYQCSGHTNNALGRVENFHKILVKIHCTVLGYKNFVGRYVCFTIALVQATQHGLKLIKEIFTNKWKIIMNFCGINPVKMLSGE